MLLNTAATLSRTWSAVSTALAEVRTPTRSKRFSIDRKRRSISRTLADIVREHPDWSNITILFGARMIKRSSCLALVV